MENNNSSWDFYFTEIEDEPASIALDLALNRIAPVKDKPYSVNIMLKMQNPQDNGFSSKEESETLFKIEDAIVPVITKKLGGIYTGRITSSGCRQFYFYTGTKDGCRKAVDECMKGFGDYDYTVDCKKDAEWSDYFEILYPLPEEMQTILNRRVINNLKEQGDKLDIPREVYHYIYFSSEEDRKSFRKDAVVQGYLAAETAVNPESENPFGLRLTRIDPVDSQSINENTGSLVVLAEEHNGIYDGWETMVVK